MYIKMVDVALTANQARELFAKNSILRNEGKVEHYKREGDKEIINATKGNAFGRFRANVKIDIIDYNNMNRNGDIKDLLDYFTEKGFKASIVNIRPNAGTVTLRIELE